MISGEFEDLRILSQGSLTGIKKRMESSPKKRSWPLIVITMINQQGEGWMMKAKGTTEESREIEVGRVPEFVGEPHEVGEPPEVVEPLEVAEPPEVAEKSLEIVMESLEGTI